MEPYRHMAGNEAVVALPSLLTETAVTVRWASYLPEHAASDRRVLLQAVARPLTQEGAAAANDVQWLLAMPWCHLAAAAVKGQAAVVEAQDAQVEQPCCAQQQSAHCCQV